MANDARCTECKRRSCICPSMYQTSTERLTKLLSHFEDENDSSSSDLIDVEAALLSDDENSQPDDNMRTFTAPEKHIVPSSRQLPVKSASSFTEEAMEAIRQLDTDNVRHMPRASSTTETEALIPTRVVSIDDVKSKDDLTKLTGGRYKAHERHKFIKLSDVSFISFSSPSGIYSEVAIVLWLDNKSYSKYPSDRYRVVLSLVHDSHEELWSVSAKLLKRNAYKSHKDDEEGQIANRLCTITEIRSEIKKMLLYLGLSPREAYKLFRRAMQDDISMIVSEYGFTTIENVSHTSLMKELEKPSGSTYSHESRGHNTWENGYPRQDYGPHVYKDEHSRRQFMQYGSHDD